MIANKLVSDKNMFVIFITIFAVTFIGTLLIGIPLVVVGLIKMEKRSNKAYQRIQEIATQNDSYSDEERKKAYIESAELLEHIRDPGKRSSAERLVELVK